MLPVFDPQDASCKSPFGAAQCGAEVTFTLRDETYYACELLVHREFAGADEAIPLPPTESGFSGVYTAPAETTQSRKAKATPPETVSSCMPFVTASIVESDISTVFSGSSS